ncbi:hypothetical protein COBT_001782 [Conglomerata obtusa]
MSSSKSLQTGKIVVIGDGACGKTCLLEVFKKNKFPEDYIPTIIDNFVETVEVDGEQISIAIWDTAGQEEYDAVRPVSYSETDLIFLCYSIENKNMLMNIGAKWMPEIRNYCPTAGTFLVALKSDLRDDENLDRKMVASEKEGQDMKDQIGASYFLECSAKKNINVKVLFTEAARWLKENKKPKATEKKWWFCFLC